jgi:hypothetical protein
MTIVLLDPSIRDNNLPSYNLGDIIIYESVKKFLDEKYPDAEIIRISSHQKILDAQKKLIKNADMSFVGGSNILTSNILTFDRMVPSKKRFFHFFPGFRNIITIGVGWSKYDQIPSFHTKVYYRNILSKENFHSMGLNKVINTGCPTIWSLQNRLPLNFDHSYKTTLFTLTDYCRDEDNDNKLIEIILKNTDGKYYFFQQGPRDREYLESLSSYKKNAAMFELLPYDYQIFTNFVNNTRFNFIGTRLHSGIKCMQSNNPALIIGVDNRAIEMHKDFKLPVVKRGEHEKVLKWIGGDMIFLEPLNIDKDAIQNWTNQFIS